MKIGVIIQARMGSTRFHGKIMREICGKTVLCHDIERVKQSKLIDEIIIASTVNDDCDPIIDEAVKCGVKSFRGSEDDVLSRYYYTALENELDIVIRITSDCPLIDPIIIDEMVQFYLENDFDVVSNGGSDLSKRTYPRGLDTEIFSFKLLEEAFNNADQKYQREHVTPYIYENSEKIFYYENDIDYSKYRITLDTEEDFELITQIYKALYKGKHDFYLEDIIELFERQPKLYEINKHIEQKKI